MFENTIRNESLFISFTDVYFALELIQALLC